MARRDLAFRERMVHMMLLHTLLLRPIPSEVTMLFGGALVSAGFAAPGQELTVAGVVLCGVAGTVAGSWLAYWAGAKGGRPHPHGLRRPRQLRPVPRQGGRW